MSYFYAIFIFALGSAIGSFLNVVIDRLPYGRTLSGRSVCDHCGKTLSWKDLVPIFSYFWLKGKCRYCGGRLSFYYPLVELITAVTFTFVFFYFSNLSIIKRVLLLGVVSVLIAIFFTDLKYMLIPDELQLVLLFFSYLYLFNCSGNCFVHSLKLLFVSLIYGVLVSLPIASIFYITKGKGMGFADVKLSINIGFLLGLKRGFLALYTAFLIGGVFAFVLLVLGKRGLKSKIPFGPFLVVSMFLLLLFPEEVLGFIGRLF